MRRQISGHETCVCGDVADEHGHDDEHPGSTACTVEDCGCVAFELDEEATEAAEKELVDEVFDHDKKRKDAKARLSKLTESRGGARKVPIAERIDAALKGGSLPYTDLWNVVFPAEDFPRRGGSPSRGGPPGSYMALSRAIDKYGFKWSVPEGGTLATRIVYPRKKKP